MKKQISLNENALSLNLYYDSRSFNANQVKAIKKIFSRSLPELESFLFNSKESGLKLKASGVKKVEVSLTLCGLQKIRSLNRDYRNKDRYTDVLSFPTEGDMRGQMLEIGPYLHMGDIIISHPIARKQAGQLGVSFESELLHLSVHGFLHLLGYDHELSPAQCKLMESLESRLIKRIFNSLGWK